MKDNLKKNFIWNSIGSTVNAFISLFLLIIVTRVNGVEDAGIFTFAYSLACLLQVIITYAGRPYQVTERDNKIKDSDFFYTRVTTAILTFFIAIVYVLIKGYNSYKISIIMLALLYKASDGLSDCFYAVLQKNEQLFKVGISLFIKGILVILSFVLCDLLTKDLILSLIVVITINIIICYFYDFKNTLKTGFKFHKVNKDKIIKILVGGFAVFAYTILIQYLVGAQKYTIDSTLETNFQTIYGIIIMPATVIVLISQFLVQPYLTTVNKLIESKNYIKLHLLVLKLSLYVILISLVAVLAAYLIGTQVLSFIYGINLSDYRLALTLIIIGASFFSLSYIISSVMMALRINNRQLFIYAIVSIVTYFESIFFVNEYQILGASIAYLLSMVFLYVLYILFYLFLKGGLDKRESISNNSNL